MLFKFIIKDIVNDNLRINDISLIFLNNINNKNRSDLN